MVTAGEKSVGKRAILEVLGERLESHRRVLQPGEVLSVGRAEPARLVIPRDQALSEAHFELTWDGTRCRLRDLGSTTGTLVSGECVAEGELPHGGWVRAGATDFMFYVERATPPPQPVETEGPERAALVDGVLEQLRTTGQRLFVVLDTARDERIRVLLRESVEQQRSLYTGPQAEALGDVAPYLAVLTPSSSLLEALVREGWGKGWGVYLSCPLPFDEVRRHLRKFLLVQVEDAADPFYFRFYDPRVLRVFLPTCALEQRNDFFGPVGRFYLEAENGSLLQFLPEK